MGYNVKVFDSAGIEQTGISISYTSYSEWLDFMGKKFSDIWFNTVTFGNMTFSLDKEQAHKIHQAITEFEGAITDNTLSFLYLLEACVYYNGRIEAS